MALVIAATLAATAITGALGKRSAKKQYEEQRQARRAERRKQIAGATMAHNQEQRKRLSMRREGGMYGGYNTDFSGGGGATPTSVLGGAQDASKKGSVLGM